MRFARLHHLPLFAALLCIQAPALAQPAPPADRLGEALRLVGFDRTDLGYQPKGYWSRYPNPDQMAWKLPFFDDLLAEPLRVYDFAGTMALAVQDQLSPEGVASHKGALYYLSYYLGVDRRLSGFRPYGANLQSDSLATAPLERAVQAVFDATGTPLVPSAFGNVFDARRTALREQAQALPEPVQRALAALVDHVLDAYRWRQQALRTCPPELVQKVFAIRDLAGFMDEGRTYYFEIDDLAKDLDERSLYYGCMKAVQAADSARRAFAAIRADHPAGLDTVHFDFSTPIGRIVLAGTGNDVHAVTDAAILVDLGGDDRYTGPVGATPSLEVPVSVAIDCAGNDTYEYAGEAPSQGAGVLGAGVLVDDAGDDTYRARQYAQGLGVFGLGLLFDREGQDQYELGHSGQGAGYFGVGLSLDSAGDDRYYVLGDGQGFGGPGGVGVLANYEGNDKYVAEPLASKAGRPDYHAQNRITYSNAQGVGAGRRGDGSDGHNWAGGLGALLDMNGDDTYEAGDFAMGVGYMYGTGLLYDGQGDDSYRSVYFTQGSGAHFCIGALIDEGGNDRHELYDVGGAGLGFGWDFAFSLLLDKGGNDTYRANNNSMGRADIRANGLLIDLGGDDEYAYPAAQQGLGVAPFQAQYAKVTYNPGPYTYYANSLGLLLDTGGQDRYLDLDPQSGRTQPSAAFGNDRTWQQPAPGSPEYGYRNFGVGMDVPDGTVPEFTVAGERWGAGGP